MSNLSLLAKCNKWLSASVTNQPRQCITLLSIIVVISALVAGVVHAVPHSHTLVDDDKVPIVTVAKTVDGDKDWTTYKGQTDNFQISLPSKWFNEFNPGDDPADEYDLYFGSKKNADPEVDHSAIRGSLAIGDTETGHGVPGAQIANANTTIDGQPATRTVWKSASLQQVQYRWVWKDKNFLLELESGNEQQAAFDTLDQIAKTIKLH